MNNPLETQKRAITPLWIIALFVSLTETVLGTAVIQTTGGIQIALTVFVLFFPLLIAGAFFLILWNRPYVLYPPTEYGNQTDISSYVNAIRQNSDFDESNLYMKINETIRATLVSDEIIKNLSKAITKHTPDSGNQITQILNTAADRTVNLIKKAGFLTIDNTPIMGSDGKVRQEPYEKYSCVSDLCDETYFTIKSKVNAKTYGVVWAFKDVGTGYIYKEMGMTWANRHQNKPSDIRSLKAVGIKAGMILETIFL